MPSMWSKRHWSRDETRLWFQFGVNHGSNFNHLKILFIIPKWQNASFFCFVLRFRQCLISKIYKIEMIRRAQSLAKTFTLQVIEPVIFLEIREKCRRGWSEQEKTETPVKQEITPEPCVDLITSEYKRLYSFRFWILPEYIVSFAISSFALLVSQAKCKSTHKEYFDTRHNTKAHTVFLHHCLQVICDRDYLWAWPVFASMKCEKVYKWKIFLVFI